MGRSGFLISSFAPLLLVLFLLLPSHGLIAGRKMASGFGLVDAFMESRELSEESIDYQLDPEPNTNPRNGFVYPVPTDDAPPPVPDW
ncbi:hypothetical protein LINGRAHAP2_LOCUS34141 [Linum grandiflorum]